MSIEQQYALLIDSENISSRYIKTIFDELTNYGIVTYRRIYGDWTSSLNQSWKEVLLDHSINPIQQYTYTSGKNASDSAMIIDAMDILYTGGVDGLCLATSDSDFTRLATRLRESGKNVIGMGESKTPNAFISACHSFKYLDILYQDEIKEQQENGIKKEFLKEYKKTHKRKSNYPEPQTKLATIRKALKAIIQEGSGEEGWIPSADVGNQLAKRFPDFDVRNYGYKKLTLFIESLGDFELDRIHDPASKTQQVFIRVKNGH